MPVYAGILLYTVCTTIKRWDQQTVILLYFLGCDKLRYCLAHWSDCADLNMPPIKHRTSRLCKEKKLTHIMQLLQGLTVAQLFAVQRQIARVKRGAATCKPRVVQKDKPGQYSVFNPHGKNPMLAGFRQWHANGFVPTPDIREVLAGVCKSRTQVHKFIEESKNCTPVKKGELHYDLAAAIIAYTETEIAEYVNSRLETPGNTDDLRRIASFVYKLHLALENLPPYRGRVFRGTNKRFGDIVLGTRIVMQRFMSTSKNPTTALSFCGGKECAFFVIDASTGRDISYICAISNSEQEVLFMTNSYFEIRAIMSESKAKSTFSELENCDLRECTVYVLEQVL